MKQSAVLIQIYILDDHVSEITQLLDSIGNPVLAKSFFPFERLTSVHFGRWLIAPATETFDASLIYSANVDGTAEHHLHELVTNAAEALDAILAHCKGYMPENERTDASRLAFLKQHFKKTPAFYVGAPTCTVEQIHAEAALHEVIRKFTAANGKQWKTKKEAYKAIRTFAQSCPEAEPLRSYGAPAKGKGIIMILFLLLLVVLLPFILTTIIILALFIEWREKPFGKLISMVPDEKMAAMKSQEDIIHQNQLSQVFETKPGLRKWILKFFLWATNFAAKNWFVKGSLMGTPTIHFARWVFIDDEKRFVFFSNFDQSYDGYLGDFVDNNGWGLNAIYGAAKGYPKTYFLFGGGSYKLLEFLGWGRTTQVKTNSFYSAYPWYGLQQIVSRTYLRYGLLEKQQLKDDEIDELLKRI